MNRLTVGDCVIILGRPWASENNIKTAEDLLKPAPEAHGLSVKYEC
jgi:hypothetical protein